MEIVSHRNYLPLVCCFALLAPYLSERVIGLFQEIVVRWINSSESDEAYRRLRLNCPVKAPQVLNGKFSFCDNPQK